MERRPIREALNDEDEAVLRPVLAGADAILDNVRDIGNAVCAAWFGHATQAARRLAQGRLESDHMQASDAWLAAPAAGRAVRTRLMAAKHGY